MASGMLLRLSVYVFKGGRTLKLDSLHLSVDGYIFALEFVEHDYVKLNYMFW